MKVLIEKKMNEKYILYILIFLLQSCVTYMTLPTWTQRGGCPIYSGVRTGCKAKSRPNFSVGYKGANAEYALLYILSFPFTLVTDTVLLPLSIPFGFGNSIYFYVESLKEAKVYEKKYPLHYASGFNQKEKVKSLLEQGVNLNSKDSNEWIPIDIALNRENYEIAILLLEHGAILDTVNEGLYEYIVKSKYKNIELISKHQPNIKNSLLYFSVYNGNSEFTKYLIKLNADVNYIYSDLPLLVWARDIDVIILLLEKGANVNIRYMYGHMQTPFNKLLNDYRWDNSTDNLKLIRLYFKYGAKISKSPEDISAATKLYNQLLGTADNDIIFLLIEHGLNINEKDYFDESLLQMAMEKGDVKVIKHLNEHGASIKKLNQTYLKSFFQNAIRENRVELVKFFLESKNMDANLIVDGHPLICSTSNLEIIKLLIANGANINEKTKENGLSTLANAVFQNQLEVVKYLISKNADKFVLNNDQETLLFYTTQHKDLTVLKFLLENGLDVNAKNKKGETVLFQSFLEWKSYCSENPNLEFAQLLLDYGADINAQDYAGNVAIHCAAVTGNIDSIKFLIKRGANSNIRGKQGLSALDYAIKYNHLLAQMYLKSNGSK